MTQEKLPKRKSIGRKLGEKTREFLSWLEKKELIKIDKNGDESVTVSFTIRNPFSKKKEEKEK
jgi:hypothetical protein